MAQIGDILDKMSEEDFKTFMFNILRSTKTQIEREKLELASRV